MELIIFLVWIVFIGSFAGISLLLTALWIWMIIDCAVHEPSEGNNKIVWILIILFAHWIGALIYLIVRRPRRKAELSK